MSKIEDKYRGANAHRLNANPDEAAFAEAWQKANEDGNLLDWLLDGTGHGDTSERDHLVAATVIQWLGSPVGCGFLREVQETNRKRNDRERKQRLKGLRL